MSGDDLGIDFSEWAAFQDTLKRLVEFILGDARGIVSIQSRVKSLEAIKAKIHRRQHQGRPDYQPTDLRDILGIRIIVADEEHVPATLETIRSEFYVHEAIAYVPQDGRSTSFSDSRHPNVHVRERFVGDSAHLVISLGSKRSALPEYARFGAFLAEVQIRSAYAEAISEMESLATAKANNLPVAAAAERAGVELNRKISEFVALLNRSTIHEKRDIHPFLDQNHFILHPNPNEVFSEAALGLGTQYRIDFLIRQADGSYLLVELENPGARLFNANGDFSALVNHAQRQVEDWQQWIEENLSLVQKHYPDMLAPMGRVVIGRSRDLSQAEKVKLARRNVTMRGRIEIITYDELIRHAKAFVDSVQRSIRT
ncbi:DUF4263 domain-containing protein [Bradyrhizobium sp. CCGB12]|uniref:Shedu anti-phage system protein SduA domain-containing protein n=1 Tax=Bradyrhizobium sp. CCGB12 TaxID=2949632 RepID=UPI0020B3C5F2|nr:Shedu anti-phage system protein SduA domain-containing protein [Bradyrhizobium sp. CCGB12]MCP3387717.1 DUF4263 domain-containing protein [Bradyrhizobium sp. CCGB12]